MTLGVEEEFFIVDTATGELVTSSDLLLESAREVLGPSVTPELNACQIEVASRVCSTLDEVRVDLKRLRRGLATAGEPSGLGIAAIGTHPFSPWGDQEVNRSSERYAQMENRFQIVARQQVICGCHVHIGFEDPELAVATMNRACPWLPALLALSANSPFWGGRDTGFMSYRTEVWQRWPTAGFGPLLESRAHFDDLIAELIAIGAIEDATYLYWYMRPSSRYPTVEFRICDVPLLVEDTVAIAGLIRALAWSCRRDAIAEVSVPRRETQAMDAAMWQAARYGLRGNLVHPTEPRTAPAEDVIESLLEYVADGLDVHGDRDRIHDAVDDILDRGNGAEQQRTIFDGREPAADLMNTVLQRSAE
jgi:glutamate---cysteine ligase / carboxylate-amine ligase